MSKLANSPIKYESGVSFEFIDDMLIVKFNKNILNMKLNGVSVNLDEKEKICSFYIDKAKKKTTFLRASLGTCVATLRSFISGNSNQYSVALTMYGVGFKSILLPKNRLLMWLGRSHLYCVAIPENIVVFAKDNKISLSGNKSSVTSIASIIKTTRKWDPCMKKGIVIDGEFLVQKEGKKKK